MWDLIKDFFRDPKVLLVVCLLVAIIGFIPLGTEPAKRIPLGALERLLIAAFAVSFYIAWPFLLRLHRESTGPSTTEEYEQRFRAQQRRVREIAPDDRILQETDVAGVRIAVINASIETSGREILVSSDDTYLQAKGGVAKAILTKAGEEVAAELERRRRRKLGHGDLAITTGGAAGALAILHPAVIDLDLDRYPDERLIRTVVRNVLRCALALGGKSVAIPVLGGGTASKYLDPWQSVRTIIHEAAVELHCAEYAERGMRDVTLYVFDSGSIQGDLRAVLAQVQEQTANLRGVAAAPPGRSAG